MRRVGVIAFFLAVAAALAALARPAPPKPDAARCGGQLWRLKTFSDGDRDAVRTTPRTTTIGSIVTRTSPSPLPRLRSTAFQRRVWQVVAQIAEYRIDGSELRLVLFDHGAYMNAVIPGPSCLGPATRLRTAIASTWTAFFRSCGRASRTWQPLGAVVHIRGVGFWSSRFRERRHAAPNGAELHPVTGFRAVAGC